MSGFLNRYKHRHFQYIVRLRGELRLLPWPPFLTQGQEVALVYEVSATTKKQPYREGEMVRVERRSGKERRSGQDRRKSYAQGHGGSGRTDSLDRRSGKDRGKSPPTES